VHEEDPRGSFLFNRQDARACAKTLEQGRPEFPGVLIVQVFFEFNELGNYLAGRRVFCGTKDTYPHDCGFFENKCCIAVKKCAKLLPRNDYPVLYKE